MATYSDTVLTLFTTDAEFRTWGSKIKAAITACGMTQTADTGQINWTTVTKPTTSNAAAGYEIWAFSDTLQATAPIYIKIEYGSTTTPFQTPQIWVTVGTGTNGAGTLTGTTSTRTALSPTSGTSGQTKSILGSGSTNRIWLAGGVDFTVTSQSWFFFVERTRDSSGAVTADGFVIQMQASTSAAFHQFGLAVGGAGGTNSAGCIVSILGSKSAVGADVALSPALIFAGKPFYPLMMGAIAADIPGNLQYTATYLGTSYTWISLSLGINSNGAMNGGCYPQVLWQ